MKKYLNELSFVDIVIYAIMSLVINYASVMILHSLFYFIVPNYVDEGNLPVSCSIAAIIIIFLLSAILCALLMPRAVKKQFSLSGENQPYHRCFFAYIVIGEALRFILSVFTYLGYYTAYPALRTFAFLFDVTQNRFAPEYRLSFVNILPLVLIYIIYFALYSSVLFLVYRRIWKRYELELTGIADSKTDKYGEKITVMNSDSAENRHEELTEKKLREKEYAKAAKQTDTADYVREILLNLFLVFAAAFVVGMVTNVILLLIGYVTSLPISLQNANDGYTHEGDLRLWFILAAVSIAACALSLFRLTQEIGTRAASFNDSVKNKTNVDIPGMIVSVVGGLAVYGALCAVTAVNAFAYLFFASPVQYIARLLGDGKRSLWADEAFDFPTEIWVYAVIVYVLIIAVGCFAGYICGYKKYKRIKADKELFDRQLNSNKNSGKTEYSYEAKEKIKRDRLPERTLEYLNRLNNARRIRYIVFTIVFILIDVLLWYLWGLQRGGMFTPSCAFFPASMIIPFYPIKAHEKVFGKNYYATVISHEIETQAVAGGGFGTKKSHNKEINTLKLRLRRGDTIALKLKLSCPVKYEKDEIVYKLSAFPCPVSCNFDFDNEVFCPNCGSSSGLRNNRCVKCGTALITKEKW